MPVKIVETKPDPSVIKRKVCHHCGVTLEYVPNDVQEGTSRDYTGGTDSYSFIQCAGCNKEVKLY